MFFFRILQCGLKAFLANYGSTLASEVSILGYLSFAHEVDLKFALKDLLQTVLCNGGDAGHVNTLPFLMRLSGLSEVLLQPIVGVFMELCKSLKHKIKIKINAFYNQLKNHKFQHWSDNLNNGHLYLMFVTFYHRLVRLRLALNQMPPRRF